jgi:dTDP-glucose 4,6-dehydratase
MKKKILLTGSCGFIFSNFLRKALKENNKYTFASVDKIIAPYNLKNIYKHENHTFYMGDIADEKFMDNVFLLEKPDIVLHAAAESFVDDSIRSAQPFVHSNIVGTQVMVDLSLKHGVERFIYTSSDEVYGQLKSPLDLSWTEESPLKPRNPYSATKAAGEMIVYAANQTHGLKYNITRCCNNYGNCQPPRNLVPRVITSILKNEWIPIHGEGKQYREWIYVEDNCSAVMKIIESAPENEIYNIGSGVELTNLDMVGKICNKLDKGYDLITFVKDRPGHDFRYSVDCSKIKKLGWQPKFDFNQGLEKTIEWYLENQKYYD